MSFRANGDCVAETAARLVHLDGAGQRCPWLFCLLFGVRVKPLPKGRLHGYFSARRRTIYVDTSGDDAVVRARLAHEIGHVMLFLQRFSFPHDEDLASEAGRAWCLGRGAILAALRDLSRQDIVGIYSEFLPPEEVSARVLDVQASVMRWVG
jgi:hypothetical protein